MAKNVLPVNFQDDILSEAMSGLRRYQMITNSDGTVSFVDVTEYDQVGSNFGQAQINATNAAVNESADKNKVIDVKADLMANTQSGMIAGALAVKEAVSELNEKSAEFTTSVNSRATVVRASWGTTITIHGVPHGIVICSHNEAYILWVSGNVGSMAANFVKMFDNNDAANALTATFDESTLTTTITAGGNSGIVFIGYA